MKRLRSSAVVAALLATTAGVALAQCTDHAKSQGSDSGQQQSMDMQSMMPMMMRMHQQMAHANRWAAADDGVFVLYGNTLLKYDTDLELSKKVDLPEPQSADSQAPQSSQERMQQMMAKMRNELERRIEVTPEAVFVIQGNTLLKYDHDLELLKTAQLPEMEPRKCPMCEQMMQHMLETSQGEQEHEQQED